MSIWSERKTDLPHYKTREELRRSAYKLRKLIKENNHDSLVITSDKTYKGAVEDFAEGLILSSYSFDKYKTKVAEGGQNNYPQKLLLHGDIADK